MPDLCLQASEELQTFSQDGGDGDGDDDEEEEEEEDEEDEEEDEEEEEESSGSSPVTHCLNQEAGTI